MIPTQLVLGYGAVGTEANQLKIGSFLTGTNINSTDGTLSVSYASTTQLSASGSLCINGDCRTAWPSGGAGVWPWTVATTYGTSTDATMTPTWFQTTFYASSTLANPAIIDNLKTTNATTSALYITGRTSALLGTDANGQVVATTSVGVNYLTGILPIANGGTATSTVCR